MLQFVTHSQAGVIELDVNGYVGTADFNRVVAEMEGLIRDHGTFNVVEVIHDFRGMDPGLWWRDVQWSFSNLSKVGRAAVVTDSGWIGPFARAAAALVPTEMRVFPMAELEAARAWARRR